MSVFKGGYQEIDDSDMNCPECGRPLWVPIVGAEGTKYCESCDEVFRVKVSTVG